LREANARRETTEAAALHHQGIVNQKMMLNSLQTKTLHDCTDMKRNTLIPTLAKMLTNPQSKMMCWTIHNKVESSCNSA